MNFFDLVNISERYMELVNPSSPEKIIKLGQFLRLQAGSQVIDFGSGYAEPLVLWAQTYGILGVGIDIRQPACERAWEKVRQQNLEQQLKIICMNASQYEFEAHYYDAAVCLGASFIFGGFSETINVLKKAVKANGKLAIGEPYWKTDRIPIGYARQETTIHTEMELYQISYQAGCEIEYLIRASQDDWDRYEADNWYGLSRWLEENPHHPDRDQVKVHLHKSQEEYFRYGREYLGWEMIVLSPVQ